ncbi:HalOD1 output domain-containing protein [Natronococcus occultus]|uniref:Halobacterial output domain-containing protein n=1 Tax=Natronococcus occultus SP4 TaxID=694430 RepID=L0JZQ2_9EURY|nr:HalOD1 output domain-containing protein [Natronococcus occultus]AGB37328.1 hypothetical protein Natoc_1521 [Natronococcus occultus SP4]
MLLSVDRSDTATGMSLSYEVIAEIAAREGVEPTDIEPPEYDALYDVINPEALDSLFAPRENGLSRASGRIEFEYCGYDVTVTSDGDVEVSKHEQTYE